MRRLLFPVAGAISAAIVAACGASTDEPAKKNPNSVGLLDCGSPSSSLAGNFESKGNNWRGKYEWEIGPIAGVSEPAESRLKLTFKTYDSKTPATLTDVIFAASSESLTLPAGAKVEIGRGGVAYIRDIHFYAVGAWEIDLTASVNGTADEASFCAKVEE